MRRPRALHATLLCWLSPQQRPRLPLRTFAALDSASPPPSSHLSLVPTLLGQTLAPGDFAVDATCGNGHDTLTLVDFCGPSGHVVACDVQDRALEATRQRLLSSSSSSSSSGSGSGSAEDEASVTFWQGNHRDLSIVDEALRRRGHDDVEGASLAEDGFATGGPVKAWVYNLGYLPGSDRSVTTQTEDTLSSIRQARDRTARGGLICVTLYVGHEGGKEEAAAVREEMGGWDQAVWRVVEHRPLNWPRSPVLLTAHRFVMPRKKLPKRNDPV